MSEHSASPRLEALESSVSEIQERMSELVGMLRQLTTETRTAGDGRRGEESGGARRDAAHIYSSGARRGPLTAATGHRVTAVQDEGTGEATAARNFPVHHRAASEPADTRPGLPTGVGPMIDVRSGEARDPYLAGITAYDQGRDVLRAEFKSLPTRVVPPVLKAEKAGFQKFKHEFFLKTNMLDITDHFVGQGMRAVPVGDPLKQKAVLLQEGFSNEEIKGAYQAWNFIDAALQSDSDRSILKRCKSPREVFERFEKWHDPDSEVATQRLYDKFHEFTIPPQSDPIAALHDLEDTNNQMHEKGIGRIPDAVVHARFVRALPDEYSLVKETLQAMKNRDRDEIIRMVSTRHSNLPRKNGAQRPSRQPEQAFVSNESGNRSGARRGRDRRGGGRQGRGRSGNNGGGESSSVGTQRSGDSSPVETQGSSDGAGSLGGSGDGRHHIPSGRCFRCRQRGHRRQDCTTRESDFVPRCNRCTGYGHEESSCSSDAAILVVELPVPEEDLAVEAQAFAVSEAGKCSVTIGDAVGGVALDKQVVQYIADSAATCNMTPDADGLTNYRECSRPLGLANGEEISIVGYGDLTVNFRTDHRWVRVKMNDVAHVPQLSHNLISLPSMTLKGHTYMGDKARGLRKSIARSTHTGADTLRLSRTPAAAAPYCQRGGVYSGGGRERGGGVKSRRRRVQGVDSEFSLGNAAEVWPPVLPATREALAAELGAGAAGVRKATPQHHRPPPGGEAPAAESGAGAAGVRKTTPRHHRPPPGGEAPAAELGAGAAGARKATPRHHRPPSGGEAPAAELGAGAAGVRKATPQHHRPPPGGEAPAAELGAGAAGARKATPRHHRPPSGGEAPAAEFAAAATGVRTATPRHQRFPPGGEAPAAKFAAAATGVRMATPRRQRFPPGGEAPAAKFAAAATGVRMATPRHQRFPPGGEAPAAKYVAAATGVRKVTPRHHRSPPGGPISVASTATVAATAARTAVPAATAAAATTVETFPPTRGDLRGTWRPSASSPYYRAATRGLSRGARPWERPARTTCWRTP